MSRHYALLLLLLFAPLLSAGGVTGRGGLEAIAVSADGKQIAVGGQNRVIYLLDSSGTVQMRRWLGVRIGNLAFTPDGKGLLVEDEMDVLHLLELATGKTLARRERVSGLMVDPSCKRLAIRDLAEPSRNRLWLLSTERLEDEGAIDLIDPPAAYTFDPAGKQLLVLSRARISDAEPRVEPRLIPRELTGLARLEYRQRNDGSQATLASFEVPTGKPARSNYLWYTSDSDSTLLAWPGEIRYILNRNNLCARVAGNGTIQLFTTPERVNHGLGVSPDGKILVTGGLGEGTHGVIDAEKRRRFEVDALPGQAEFFTRFAVANDGSAWGVTSASRLVQIDREGTVQKVIPVY